MSFKIEKILAREILDSRGNPTVEVEVYTPCGAFARASVPSGASTGEREAIERRDGDKNRFGGKGVKNAVNSITHEISDMLIGQDIRDQKAIDNKMIALDGTENKSKLGANAILGVSLAVARLTASVYNMPLYRYIGGMSANLLPVPCMNIINGGVHARGQGADFQEYMIAPVGAPTFREAMRWGSEVYQTLRQILISKGLSAGVGDEGGFAPIVSSNRQPLELIVQAIEQAGYRPGDDIGICMDPASSEFCKEGKYHLRTENVALTSQEMTDYYQGLIKNFPIILLEDGLAEDDWDGWKYLNDTIGHQVELVGDDLFVTNVKYIQRGIDEQLANAALIKLNQIGSLSETIDAVHLCHQHGWGTFISHRSGETVDSFIADMTVGLMAGHLKTGAPCRGERIEKYNQLMRIEEELGSAAVYAGKSAFVTY
ncbi:phosphopyruvate hydratase [Pectobacteriaceae bacterium CE70]|uniref:Enolase n=1 Tax=Serratia sp. (strain ATCC 39006) TaxID=104623 RepID=A0A2I5TJ64_SERS3|nr:MULTISPECIES: phosphopyruvate hydratase [Enterobacterales]WJV56806.1 phosphopyruvate hydratase [Pectobacteriaceae bacterium C111]WJV61166.1 phosphopyruvate hydratase [Pectobacteriaceae bacterium C52]WJV65494.1 phosphopyruvate hydratase [Pectobacteriaceae bacterium CE70]WJY09514.1 phosphopyruvate hydratase [Pectobacteriaceae bacterium C80]WJY16537.1 phosphopyruvate hydratase [Pectobacteriaceae bacterium CE90]